MFGFLAGNWKLLVAGGLAFAAAILFGLWQHANVATERAERNADEYRAAYDSKRVALDEMESQLALQAEALADREANIQEIKAQRDAFETRWKEALRNDEETRVWADQPLPFAVRRLLREDGRGDADGDREGAPSGVSDGPDG